MPWNLDPDGRLDEQTDRIETRHLLRVVQVNPLLTIFKVRKATRDYHGVRELDALGARPLQVTRTPAHDKGERFDWDDRQWAQQVHDYYRVPPYWM